MPQLSLYMDEPMMEGLRQDAAREGKTLSKFVAGVLRDRDTSGLLPHGFFDLYGACDDDTLVEPPDDPFDLEPIPALELA